MSDFSTDNSSESFFHFINPTNSPVINKFNDCLSKNFKKQKVKNNHKVKKSSNIENLLILIDKKWANNQMGKEMIMALNDLKIKINLVENLNCHLIPLINLESIKINLTENLDSYNNLINYDGKEWVKLPIIFNFIQRKDLKNIINSNFNNFIDKSWELISISKIKYFNNFERKWILAIYGKSKISELEENKIIENVNDFIFDGNINELIIKAQMERSDLWVLESIKTNELAYMISELIRAISILSDSKNYQKIKNNLINSSRKKKVDHPKDVLKRMLMEIKTCGPKAAEVIAEKYKSISEIWRAYNHLPEKEARILFEKLTITTGNKKKIIGKALSSKIYLCIAGTQPNAIIK